MKNVFKSLIVIPLAALVLGGCTEITSVIFSSSPADASNCEYWDGGGEGFLCVECNSGSNEQASVEACGVEITARCNSKEPNDVFGIAVGGFVEDTVEFSFLTATAWYDEGGDGPDQVPFLDVLSNDIPLCHEQSGSLLQSKQEWKCTSELTGNGKNDTTFEVEVKYDASKNDCA